MRIGAAEIGTGHPCFIIAEVGMAHDGSLGMAHGFIEAIAEAGADAVKFQCHIAAAESHIGEPWRVAPLWPQDSDRFHYWLRTGFGPHEWAGLAKHAEDVGLEFLCSPFSVEAVRLLNPLVPAWKVASGEVGHTALFEAIAETGKPVLLSTGMSTIDEIDTAVDYFADKGIDVQPMQCTSAYPCPTNKVGLWEAAALGGLSDHSGSIYPGLGAVGMGVTVLEVHVTMSRWCWGFDVDSSITVEELGQLVEGARVIETAKTTVRKDDMAKELEPMREIFMGKWRDKK